MIIKKHLINYFTLVILTTLGVLNPYCGIGQVYRGSVESQAKDIKLVLKQEGFQNIQVIYDYDQLLISYENRRYRLEAQAIKKIASLVTPKLSKGIRQLRINSKKLNIPILETTIPLIDTSYAQQNAHLSDNSNWTVHFSPQESVQKFSPTALIRNGNYRIELEIKPELRLALGGFPDPIVHQFNLLPTLHFYLWKGARFSFQTSLPIWNEFENPAEKFWRPRIIQLEQRFRLSPQTFASFSVGYFTKNRYGAVAEFGKYFWNGNLLLRGKIGYTGYANYENEPVKVWKIGHFDYLDYKVGIDYYFKKWKVLASVDYAKTLFNQTMLRGGVSKYFKETEIGFFVFQTERGHNYGFHCSIPLFPKKYFKPGFFSIRPSSSFEYTYHGTQNYVTQYQTLQDLRTFMRRFEPFFIQQQLHLEN